MADELTYSWSCSAGYFKGPTDQATVTWVTPHEAEEGIILTCTVNDLPLPIPSGEWGTRDDPAVMPTVTVHVDGPQVTIDYPGGGAVVGGLTECMAGAVDQHGINPSGWSWSYKLHDDGIWINITNIYCDPSDPNTCLAEWNTAGLPDDTYDLRASATCTNGFTASDTITVRLDRDAGDDEPAPDLTCFGVEAATVGLNAGTGQADASVNGRAGLADHSAVQSQSCSNGCGSGGTFTTLAQRGSQTSIAGGDVLGGWTHPFNAKLRVIDVQSHWPGWKHAVLFDEAGKRHWFKSTDAGDTWDPVRQWNTDKLYKEGNSYRLIHHDGTELEFSMPDVNQPLSGTIYRLASLKDDLGNSWSCTYDPITGRLTTITEPHGRAIILTYNGQGRITSMQDWASRQLVLEYDGSGRLWHVTNPLLATTTFTYHGSKLASITDFHGHTVSFGYDGEDRISSITDPRGKVSTVTYTQHSRIFFRPKPQTATITDPLSHTTTYHFDMVGDYLGRGYLLGIIPRLSKVTDALNKEVLYEYYTGSWNIQRVTDRYGMWTSFLYDERHNITEVCDALSHHAYLTYNNDNQVTSVTDFGGHTTGFSWMGVGRLVGAQDPLGHTVSISRNPDGTVSSVTDPRNHVWNYSYDSYGRLTDATDPYSHTTHYGYDTADNCTSVEDANGHTTYYTYDTVGRVTQVTFPDIGQGAKTQQYVWDCCNLLSITDENNKTTTYDYLEDHSLWKVTDALNHVTEYHYDDAGRLNWLKDGRGKMTGYSYDFINRVTGINYPDGTSESFAYDLPSAYGHEETHTDGLGWTIGYEIDALGRVTTVDYPTGTDTVLTYNADSLCTSMVDASGTTTYGYDNDDRLTSITYPGNKILSYVYDQADNRTQMTDVESGITTYEYDDAGQLTSITNPFNEITSFTYDNAGRCTRMTSANGAYAEYGYNARDWLTSIAQRKNDSTLIWSGGYTYDHVGNRTQLSESTGDITTWTYDDVYQLLTDDRTGTGAYSRTYTYDATGNRLTMVYNGVVTTYTYDDNNKLTQYVCGGVTTTFGYDNNGNTIEMVAPGIGTTTYSYDYDNRLTGITFPNLSTASYTYDGAGNRISATEGGVTTHFLYDGDQVYADYDGSWNLLAKYTGGISQRRGITSHFSMLDGLGSVRGLLTTGQVLSDSFVYDAFGTITDSSGSTINPYGYVGALGYRRSDSASGLLHLGAREYNPATGRFLTRDPIGYAGGLNLYGYVGNNPTGWVDPSGLSKGILQKIVDWFDLSPTVKRQISRRRWSDDVGSAGQMLHTRPGIDPAEGFANLIVTPGVCALSGPAADALGPLGELAYNILARATKGLRAGRACSQALLPESLYSERVLGRMANTARTADMGHGFPFSFDPWIISHGTATIEQNGAQISYRMPGWINSSQGIFTISFRKVNGVWQIWHRCFTS